MIRLRALRSAARVYAHSESHARFIAMRARTTRDELSVADCAYCGRRSIELLQNTEVATRETDKTYGGETIRSIGE